MIFVNIASYRDPECMATVRHLFNTARFPKDITVGLVQQIEPGDHTLFYGKNVRALVVQASDSRGVCWARHMGYRLWDGEDYVLQIDSHMRFIEHWDEKMLRQLDRCGVAKPILTAYPPAYEPPDTLVGIHTAFLAAVEMEPNGRLVQRGLIHAPTPPEPLPSAFMAAGFLFGPSQWIHDVPYDPYLYFWGEETTTAARLWTHGWDMFGPSEALLWHWYNRGGNLPWQDDPELHRRDALSMARMRHLLGIEQGPPEALIDLNRYGFGSTRTFDAYQAFAGVNFRERTVAPHAIAGEWPRYSTPASRSRLSSSVSTPQSVPSTSSVCSPSSGGRVISAGESDSFIGQPTV
jgi:glycosyltransferase involved in cell wall biosynthesis